MGAMFAVPHCAQLNAHYKREVVKNRIPKAIKWCWAAYIIGVILYRIGESFYVNTCALSEEEDTLF